MDLLARREYSRRELERKLAQKIPTASAALRDEILTVLEREGLLSDERFCEAFVRSRLNKGFGPLRVRAELRERGIEDQLIEHYLHPQQEIGSQQDGWLETLCALIVKKYGPHPDTDARSRARQHRFLLQRGYSFEQIKAAFARFQEGNF